MLSLYHLCIMVLVQIHPTQKLWIISDMRSVRVSQCAPKLSQGAPSLSQWRCPESVSRCPHLFQAHIVTAKSSINQLQASATGICSIQILILARSTVPNMASQVTPGGVSRCIHICRKNLLFQKLNIWGVNFFRLKVPQCPLPIGLYLNFVYG